jgi:hypothetical protein
MAAGGYRARSTDGPEDRDKPPEGPFSGMYHPSMTLEGSQRVRFPAFVDSGGILTASAP